MASSSQLPFAPSLAALLLALVAIGCRQPAEESASQPPGPVTLEIQREESDVARYEVPDVPPGTTVEEVLKVAAATENGPDVEITGSGATAFVRSIDGQASEAQRGWLFFVNDQWAERGVGQFQVTPGDVIRFEYGSFPAREPRRGESL